MKYWMMLILIGLGLMAGGCGPADLPDRGDVIDSDKIEEGAQEDLGAYLDNLDTNAEDPWQSFWDTGHSFFRYSWVKYRVNYLTQDASGNTILVSGLAVIPKGGLCRTHPISVPMLSLQHPTQVERKYSPSDGRILDPELTVPTAMALAATGYIVVVPDYPGMGVDSGTHPYCHKSLAYSVIDMMRAVRDGGLLEKWQTRWDGRLYLMGYSEGGYATMVTAEELQLHHTDEFTVNGVAPLDGPYSLSVAMKKVILNSGPEYSAPYFLPYTLIGYDSVYHHVTSVFNFEADVKNSIPNYTPKPNSNYALDLLARLDGYHTGGDITDFMHKVSPYAGANSILTDSFVRQMQDPAGVASTKLAENDAFSGWVPTMPVKMFHNVNDDLVPCENADLAYAGFQQAGATTVELEKYEKYYSGLGSVHAGSLPVAYYLGFMWLDSLAYPERH